jgi:hypothetical protein
MMMKMHAKAASMTVQISGDMRKERARDAGPQTLRKRKHPLLFNAPGSSIVRIL